MRRWWAALWLLCGLLPAAALAAPKVILLYSFSGGTDGAQPDGPLVMDRTSGVLYGTTLYGGSGYGTVFSLTPPAPGKTGWTETVLVAFDGVAGGAYPGAGLAIDRTGNLYGTTANGGPNGTTYGSGVVFEVVPPAPGTTRWREKLLHTFHGGTDGAAPEGGLVLDAGGALYGTTAAGGAGCSGGCGTAFKLAPPQGGNAGWTKTEIYRFAGSPDGQSPLGTLTIGPAGALVGTTQYGGKDGHGTVFSLAPPAAGGAAWTEAVLHSFSNVGSRGWYPAAGVLADANGDLFGTTPNADIYNGIVFSLTPPGAGQGRWVEDVLHLFRGYQDGGRPNGLTAGAGGVLFGTTVAGGPYEESCDGAGCGVVFKLTPPQAGRMRWHETTVYAFQGLADGGSPRDALISDARGTLYGTTQVGGAHGDGTVFEIVP